MPREADLTRALSRGADRLADLKEIEVETAAIHIRGKF